MIGVVESHLVGIILKGEVDGVGGVVVAHACDCRGWEAMSIPHLTPCFYLGSVFIF